MLGLCSGLAKLLSMNVRISGSSRAMRSASEDLIDGAACPLPTARFLVFSGMANFYSAGK
jgi:hypothetical protein